MVPESIDAQESEVQSDSFFLQILSTSYGVFLGGGGHLLGMSRLSRNVATLTSCVS